MGQLSVVAVYFLIYLSLVSDSAFIDTLNQLVL